jgi:hypothetical protein
LDDKLPIRFKAFIVLLERLAVVLLCLESRSERLEFFVDGKFGLGQLGVICLEREQPVCGALRRLERFELLVNSEFGLSKLVMLDLEGTQLVLNALKRVLSVSMLTEGGLELALQVRDLLLGIFQLADDMGVDVMKLVPARLRLGEEFL